MREGKYILDKNGEPVQEPDVLKWGPWYEENDRFVAKTRIGKANVSTVFLALDRQWGEGPPELFETMVFGMPDGHELEEAQYHYATRDEALQATR